MKRIVLVALVVLGCGGEKKASSGGAGADDGKVASCNMPSAGSCREYRGANLAIGTESLAKLCSPQISASAKFADVPCPTERLLATCQMREHKDFYYEGSLMPIGSAEKECTRGNGTFTTGR